MRCVTIEELAVVSGGGDPNGCKSDIAAGAGIGAAVGTAVGGTIGAVVGTVAGPGGTGMGAAYGGAIGSEIGLLAGGAVAAANSPACQPDADSFNLNSLLNGNGGLPDCEDPYAYLPSCYWYLADNNPGSS